MGTTIVTTAQVEPIQARMQLIPGAILDADAAFDVPIVGQVTFTHSAGFDTAWAAALAAENAGDSATMPTIYVQATEPTDKTAGAVWIKDS